MRQFMKRTILIPITDEPSFNWTKIIEEVEEEVQSAYEVDLDFKVWLNQLFSESKCISEITESLIKLKSEISADYASASYVDRLQERIKNIENNYSHLVESNSDRIAELESMISNYVDSKQSQFNIKKTKLNQNRFYSSNLEDIIHQNSKIKFKNKKTKENSKIQLQYDSLNPGLIEIEPLAGNKIALTSHSRNIDSNDNFSNMLIYDPLNSEYNESQKSKFFEKMNEHSANGTLDSIVRSLNNPKINRYLDKKIDPKFKKHIDSITEILSENYSGNNSDILSDVTNLTIYKNKKSRGFNFLKKNSSFLGFSGTAAPIAIKASSLYDTLSKIN